MDKQRLANRMDKQQSPLHRNKLDSYIDKCYKKIDNNDLYCDPYGKFEDNEDDDDKDDNGFLEYLYG